ncbi:Synaptotagmin-10 [Stylophora pistillata]|uniref:Synaptotagmin-10 n=1 Tax=Stylophora pistillata TaxID=50429 RepID=A0A2B4SS47_STYPI|nr:Synaptotagmin-10 [Stylophora pistillata]
MKRAHSYRYIMRTPSEDFEISSATDGSPSPKLLEASLRPPTQPPFSVGDVQTVHIQPRLVRRSPTDFTPSGSPATPLTPKSPGTPGFFDDLGSLDPSLYTMVAEESGCSTSESGSPLTHNLGQAHFIIKFDQHRSILSVKLVKAMNLSPLGKEWSKPCNPYVIVQLLPDYRHQLQSTVHKKTTNPRFDETFEFEKQVALGELMVSLGYLKSAERLTVVIIKARNLPAVNIKGTDQTLTFQGKGKTTGLFHFTYQYLKQTEL